MGDRVQHSLSPVMHQASYEALELPYRYTAILVEEGEFALAADHLYQLGYLGANVTAPLKEEAYAWALHPDELVLRTRAANTVRFSDQAATNTDVFGFLRAFVESLPGADPVLLLGAGGAARAALLSLRQQEFDVTIWNRTAAKAEQLAHEFGATVITNLDSLSGFRGLVNATRPDASGDGINFPFERLDPNCGCYDLSYGPNGTRFSQAAHEAGLRSFDGKSMLVHQGAIALEWWLGVSCDYSMMAKAIGMEGSLL